MIQNQMIKSWGCWRRFKSMLASRTEIIHLWLLDIWQPKDQSQTRTMGPPNSPLVFWHKMRRGHKTIYGRIQVWFLKNMYYLNQSQNNVCLYVTVSLSDMKKNTFCSVVTIYWLKLLFSSSYFRWLFPTGIINQVSQAR